MCWWLVTMLVKQSCHIGIIEFSFEEKNLIRDCESIRFDIYSICHEFSYLISRLEIYIYVIVGTSLAIVKLGWTSD